MDDSRLKSISLDELLSQYTLNNALLLALNIEASDDCTAYLPAYEALQGALASTFATQAGSARKTFKPSRGAQGSSHDAAYRHYLRFVKQCRAHYGEDLASVTLPPALWSESVQQEILGDSSGAQASIRHPDPAMRAYRIARANLGLAKARCAALEYLAEQLPESMRASNSMDLALVGLYTCLSTRFVMHQSTVLKFAMLLGGQPLEETRQEVLKHTFGPRKPIMEYLATDGVTAETASSAEEAAFRASIASHARRA